MHQGGETLRDKHEDKQIRNSEDKPLGWSAKKHKQRTLQQRGQVEKLTKKEEKEIVNALVDQLMVLMKNSTNYNNREKKMTSKKAMIWPNKMIPWLKKVLMNKLLGNEADTNSNAGLSNVVGYSQATTTNTNSDAELPIIQSNNNLQPNEYRGNYDGPASENRMHHHNLKTFPLLKMLKSRLNSGTMGMSGGPNLAAKQLLSQLLGGVSDRGAVIREMLQEFSMSNGNDRDSTEAREAYNELLGSNTASPQSSVFPGLGPGTTSLAQDKPVNIFAARSQQSDFPMPFAGGRAGAGVAGFTDESMQPSNLFAREAQLRLAQQAGLPRPLIQKLMAEGDTLEEIKDPNTLGADAMLPNAQSPIGMGRALQLARARAQLGQTRAELQESPDRLVSSQSVPQAASVQNLLPMRRNFPLNRNQALAFQSSPNQLGLRNSAQRENFNSEGEEVNRLMRLGPNYSAWPKGSVDGQLPGELGTNMESLAQQRSLGPQLSAPAVGANNALSYFNRQNVLQAHVQQNSFNPGLVAQSNQLRPRGHLSLPALGLQSFLGNRAGLRLTAASRLNNQRITEGPIGGILNIRRANLPAGKSSSKKLKKKNADAVIVREKTEKRSLEYFMFGK